MLSPSGLGIFYAQKEKVQCLSEALYPLYIRF